MIKKSSQNSLHDQTRFHKMDINIIQMTKKTVQMKHLIVKMRKK